MQVGHDHGHPAEVVGLASTSWCAEPCSSAPSTHACSGVYRALTRWPGPSGSGGSRSGTAITSAYPPVPRPRSSARGVEQHPVAGCGRPVSSG